MTDHLFTLPSDAVTITSDDCYTPRWIFDAMGLEFDLDVAAPPGGPWHVPAKRWYTAEDDGLTQPWDGLVWCNPPFSNYRPWAERFLIARKVALLGLMSNNSWLGPVLSASDCVAFLQFRRFHRPNGDVPADFRQRVFVAFRGIDTSVLRKVAEVATPGPWTTVAGSVVSPSASGETTGLIARRAWPDEFGPQSYLNAAHIATFDPPTVLALLDEVDDLRAKVARVEALPRHRMKVGWANFDALMVSDSDLRAALAGTP